MPFLLEQRGEYEWKNLRALDVDEFKLCFISQAAVELKAVKATHIEVIDNKVLFKGGVFRFVANWNVLIWIDRGHIEAVPSADGLLIRYILSFRQLLLVSLAGIAAMLAVFISKNSSFTIVELLALSVAGWLLIFGLNWLIAVVRFPLLIERILKATRI